MSNDHKLFWIGVALIVSAVLNCASIYYIVDDMDKVRVLWGMQGTMMTLGVVLSLYSLQSGHESGHTAGYLDGMNDETPIDREGISEGLRRRIIERDAFTCSYCHGEGEPNRDPDGNVWEIDHVIPVSKGGRTHQGNLTLSCFRCNRTKSNKTPVQLLHHRRDRTIRRR